ncbi:MAG: fluoride efflux transporter FluC [Candidatus Bathyarchaeia archaeon]
MKWDLLYLAVGAILGALLRYRITSQNLFFNGLPVSVLFVNVVGSLVLGVSATTIARFGFDARFTLLIGIGFCGALTTMSSFAYETMGLIDVGSLALAGLEIILNVGASILAVFAGRAIVLILIGAS